MSVIKVFGVLTIISLASFAISSCGDSKDAANPNSREVKAAANNAVTVSIPQGSTGQGPAAYGVNPLVITTGTTVTWVNNDSVAHTATSDTGVWDSGTIEPGQNFSFTFSTAGTFPYHCTIHGAASMSGEIQVNDVSASPSPSSSASPSPSPSASASPLPTPSPSMNMINTGKPKW